MDPPVYTVEKTEIRSLRLKGMKIKRLQLSLLNGASFGSVLLIRILFTFKYGFKKSLQPLLALHWGVCFEDKSFVLLLRVDNGENAIFLFSMFKANVHQKDEFCFHLKKHHKSCTVSLK